MPIVNSAQTLLVVIYRVLHQFFFLITNHSKKNSFEFYSQIECRYEFGYVSRVEICVGNAIGDRIEWIANVERSVYLYLYRLMKRKEKKKKGKRENE